MLTRREAIEDINLGRGIQLRFVGQNLGDGRTVTFNIILRRNRRGGCEAVIDCNIMRRCYVISHVSGRQVLAFIRRHYPKHGADSSDVITLNHMPVVPCVTVAA